MIWTTILIWLIAAGFLAGLAGLLALSEGMLALIVIPVALGVFVFPIAGAVAGYQAAYGKASLLLSLGITFVLGLFIFIFSTRNSHAFDADSLIAFAPLLAVLLSFGMTHWVLYAKGVHVLLYGVSILSVCVICFINLYLLGAYQSKIAYFGLPEELFFVRPQNDVTNVHVLNNESVLKTETGGLFTGKIISYKKRLNLNFWTKKESGIAYYIDGLNAGESGDIVPQGNYNSMYGSYAGATLWYANAPENQNKNHTFLLHKNYQCIIESEFSGDDVVYYEEVPQDAETFNPFPLPSLIVVFANDSTITRKLVSFQSNGVVKSIASHVLENKEAEWKCEVLSFDRLGFRNEYESQKVWNENDFTETQFDSYQAVKKHAKRQENPIQITDKMRYVPEPENWKYDNIMDNLVAVHGFPLTTIYTAIPVKGHWKWLANDEARDLCEIIHRSTLTINYRANQRDTYDFQRDALKIYIQSEQQDKTIELYFANDTILVNDGPYYFDVLAEKPNESKEDRAFRKKIYGNMLKIVEKYRTPED